MAWLAPAWVPQLPGINPNDRDLCTGTAGAGRDDTDDVPGMGAACGEMAQFCDRLNRFRSTSFIGWLSWTGGEALSPCDSVWDGVGGGKGGVVLWASGALPIGGMLRPRPPLPPNPCWIRLPRVSPSLPPSRPPPCALPLESVPVVPLVPDWFPPRVPPRLPSRPPRPPPLAPNRPLPISLSLA